MTSTAERPSHGVGTGRDIWRELEKHRRSLLREGMSDEEARRHAIARVEGIPPPDRCSCCGRRALR